MKKIIIILLILLASSTSWGQDEKSIKLTKDSLSIVDDDKKGVLLYDIVLSYYNINLDSTAFYSEMAVSHFANCKNDSLLAQTLALQAYTYYSLNRDVNVEDILARARSLAQSSKSRKALLESYNISGAYYTSISKIDIGLKFFMSVYEMSKLYGNRVYELRSLNNIGAIYARQGKLPETIEYFTRALKLVKGTKDKRGECTLLANIGGVYLQLNDYEKSLEYYNIAYKKAKESNLSEMIFLLRYRLADYYYALKRYDLSKEFFNQALDCIEGAAKKGRLPIIYGCLADISLKEANNNLAHIYFKRAFELTKEYPNDEYLAINSCTYANLLIKELRFSEAMKFLDSAEKLAIDNDFINVEKDVTEAKANLFYRLKDYKSAYSYNLKFHSLADTISTRLNVSKSRELNYRFESEKKELENSLLAINNNISNTSLNNAKHTFIALFIFVVLLILIILLIHIGRKRELVKRKELEDMNMRKDRLFSMISKDLRYHFTSVVRFANIIHNSDDLKNDRELASLSKLLVNTSGKTIELFDSVLSWAKTQAGGMKLNFVVVDLPELINMALTNYEALLHEKSISVDFNNNSRTYINVDEDITKTILRNVFSYFIKFSHANNSIYIDYFEEDEKIILTFKHKGIAMTKFLQSTLFDESNSSVNKADNEIVMSDYVFSLHLIKELALINGGAIWFDSDDENNSFLFISFMKA